MARDQKSEDVYKEIDENLRLTYEELVNEELPERFKLLVQQLKAGSQVSQNTQNEDYGDVE